jgi:hypothetical protein
MNQPLIITVLCLLVPLGTMGQTARSKLKPADTTHSVQLAIEKLVDEYAEAAKKGDVSFFEKNVARDYIGIDADGHMSTKPEVLELYRSGKSKFDTLEVKDRKVRLYASSAVAISELTMKGHSGTAELNGTYRSIRVLERQNGRWQSVSFQLTKVQWGKKVTSLCKPRRLFWSAFSLAPALLTENTIAEIGHFDSQRIRW